MMLHKLTPVLTILPVLLLFPAFGPTISPYVPTDGSPSGNSKTTEPVIYYLNKNRQSSGDHEVHREDCRYVPAPKNRLELGAFTDCREAVREAKRRGYPTADGCSFCAPACDHG